MYIHHCGVAGGASTSLINLLRNLPKDRILKYVITPKGPVTKLFRPLAEKTIELSTSSVSSFMPSAEGIDLILPKSLVGYVRHYPSLHEIVTVTKAINPDIVHINDTPLLPTAMTLHKMGFPVVMHARTAPGRKPGFFDRLQRKWINRHVEKLICISESVRKGFADIARTEVIYNPIANPATGQQRKLPLGKNAQMNCLFLSNFLPYKGIYETLEAALLLRDRKDIHFYIAGSNIRNSGFYQSLLGRLLDRINLVPDIERRLTTFVARHDLRNVTLLGHVDDIDTLISTMHVNLAPMRLNAPPRSVFEAAIHQVPTILALTDLMEDCVEDDRSGLIIPPRDPKAIAEAIVRLREDEALRHDMGWHAMQKLTQQHNPVIGAKKLMNIYFNLTGIREVQPAVEADEMS